MPYIPRLLNLVDQNPYSKTYGCFDRSYWHYRTMDFPCGMAQEMVLPLALVYKNKYEENKFYKVKRIKEIATAAVYFGMNSSHKDGTCDDYFPYERAMGALVFSLYAATESYKILELNDAALLDFFLKRVSHLEKENETGRLSNHQALAALAAYNVYILTDNHRAKDLAISKAKLALDWQNKQEGWFQEYEGADPGYQTYTIDFLAKLLYKMNEHGECFDFLVKPLIQAVDFAWHFMHPDGSYGGEYGSRNTYHFMPHGFEIMSSYTEKASHLTKQFLLSIDHGRRYHNDCDRMTAHYVYNFLQAWKTHKGSEGCILKARQKTTTKWFREARLVVHWNGLNSPHAASRHMIANLSKGGVIKIFDKEGPIASDTGVIAELNNGLVVVTHLVDTSSIIQTNLMEKEFILKGHFCYRRKNQMTVLIQILMRLWMFFIGRFNANLTRSVIQKIAITGKPKSKYKFIRKIVVLEKKVIVKDYIDDNLPVKRISIGSDATSIYIASSQVYQESRLCPWQNTDWNQLPKEKGYRVWEREYYRGSGHGIKT